MWGHKQCLGNDTVLEKQPRSQPQGRRPEALLDAAIPRAHAGIQHAQRAAVHDGRPDNIDPRGADVDTSKP